MWHRALTLGRASAAASRRCPYRGPGLPARDWPPPKPIARLGWHPDARTDVAPGTPEAAMCVQDFDVQCVLQFTLVNASGCALHRCTNRVIHRSQSRTVSHGLLGLPFSQPAVMGVAWSAERRPGGGCLFRAGYLTVARLQLGSRASRPGPTRPRTPARCLRVCFACAATGNDPSAGSPTETLLRLLLPLNDQV